MSSSINNPASGVPLIRITGESGSGKTTLLEQLLPRLKARGIKAGVIKHAHHGFDLDRPGKDSWRYAQAGAQAVALIGPSRAAWFTETPQELSAQEVAHRLGGDLDLILVEGFKRDPGPRVQMTPGATQRMGVTQELCQVGVFADQLTDEEWDRIIDFLKEMSYVTHR